VTDGQTDGRIPADSKDSGNNKQPETLKLLIYEAFKRVFLLFTVNFCFNFAHLHAILGSNAFFIAGLT